MPQLIPSKRVTEPRQRLFVGDDQRLKPGPQIGTGQRLAVHRKHPAHAGLVFVTVLEGAPISKGTVGWISSNALQDGGTVPVNTDLAAACAERSRGDR